MQPEASATALLDAPLLTEEAIPVWGGVECTCNRVGDRYFDQMDLSGHSERIDEDFVAIAALGIRTVRVGMLWERFERDGGWHAMDASLAAIRAQGIRPIAGLVHHGSGPPHTDLLDPEFPQQLAAYAGAFAQRYPWIDAYTPVNEPNTTARFSGRYGTWYPHHQSAHSYLRALLHQVKATVLSMQAIRDVRPDAQLIQTDDLGSITGTEPMRATWEMLNLRHWLGFDLLFGRVDRTHPMFEFMLREGISEREVLWFRDHPCPPQVVGVNYYVTSDRFIDHRLSLYPRGMRSSEGFFADVEAVRVEGMPPVDVARPLIEAWKRYGVPVALTEVHLGAPVEQQIRWLAAAQEGIARARREGVKCVALTVWALLGSYFWNQLVTCDNGHYEPGVFDVRSGIPQPTALADVVASIANGTLSKDVLQGHEGWWQREDRVRYPWYEPHTSKAA